MKKLEAEITINIRFGETDAMGVVWHGNYLKYLEDAREAFGLKHNLNYLDLYNNGYFTPIVKVEMNYKSPLYYGDQALVRIHFVPNRSAKIVFEYEILNLKTNQISSVCTTTQVFLEVKNRILELNKPDFYKAWETKSGIIH